MLLALNQVLCTCDEGIKLFFFITSRETNPKLTKSYYHYVDSNYPLQGLTLPEIYEAAARRDDDHGITWCMSNIKYTHKQLYDEVRGTPYTRECRIWPLCNIIFTNLARDQVKGLTNLKGSH